MFRRLQISIPTECVGSIPLRPNHRSILVAGFSVHFTGSLDRNLCIVLKSPLFLSGLCR